MRKHATMLLALTVLASAAALAQGRRINVFPYAQAFTFVTGTTSAFPTTNVDGGEFTHDAGTSQTFTTDITAHGLANAGGGMIRLQSTGTSPAGIVWHGDFTGRTAGSLSIDWTKVVNNTASVTDPAVNQLRIATNGGSGAVFTDIPLVAWPQFDNTATTQSGTLTVSLPTGLSNKPDVRVRIYSINVSGTGAQPRVDLDDLAISAACPTPSTPSITGSTATNTNRVELTLAPGTATDTVVVIRRAGAAPMATPSNNVMYTQGQGLNATDTVAFVGRPGNGTIAIEGLQTGVNYTFDVYGYRYCVTQGLYSTRAATSLTTLACGGAPGQITGVMDVARSQTSVTLDYVRSLRTDSVLVLRRLRVAPSVAPSNGTRYTTGQALNALDTVAYFGPASDVITVNGLRADSLYYFAVYGFQSCNATYSTAAGIDSARTYCPTTNTIGNVTDLQVLYTTANSAGLMVSGPSDVQNVIIFSRGPDTSRAVPTPGRVYSIGEIVGDDTVRFVGPARRPIITGLAQNTPYEFFALALLPCNFAYSALGDTVLTRTLATCIPTTPAIADSITVTRNVADTLRLRWRRAPGADRYLVVARIDSTPTVGPMSGTWYLQGDSLGRATVLANTTDTTANITGIPRNTALFIRVYAFTNCALTYGSSSALFTTATLGTDSSQRFALRAGRLDTIAFGGATIQFAEAPSQDGSILITRRTGHPGTLGIPMQRNNEPVVNNVSADRWWQLSSNGLGEFDVRLLFDVTDLPGMQDVTDLEIIYRPTTGSSWTDIRTQGWDTQNGRTWLFSRVQPFVGEYAIGANSARNILPVKLTSFEGFSRGRENVLRWATASEENNAGFRLARATAGSEEFTTVADYTTDSRLIGAGTSSAAHRYGYVDADAALTRATRYVYRLEEISLDGAINEVGRVAVEMRALTGATIASIAPNPASSGTMSTLRFTVTADGPLAVTLVDVTGATVRTLVEQTAATTGERSIAFAVDGLAAGTYFCRITSNGVRTIVPVVVTH